VSRDSQITLDVVAPKAGSAASVGVVSLTIGKPTRAYVAFDLSALPALPEGTNVQKATLRPLRRGLKALTIAIRSLHIV
jgi:hypothetical protein